MATSVGVIACGGTSAYGEADKSARQILADATTCLRNATSVHFKGSATTSGATGQFEEDITSKNVGSGAVDVGGDRVQFVAVNGQFYVYASAGIWTALGASTSEVPLLANNWVIAPPVLSSQFGSVVGFSGLAGYLSEAGTAVSKAGATTTPDGRQGIKLTAGQDAVYVSASGQACPIYLHVGVGTSGPADVALSNFGEAVVVTPPPSAVDGTHALGG